MTAALYRQWIREALNTAAPFAVPEEAMKDLISRRAGGGFDLSEYRRALEWNLAQDYIRSAINPDTDAKEWKLTPKGAAKQS